MMIQVKAGEAEGNEKGKVNRYGTLLEQRHLNNSKNEK